MVMMALSVTVYRMCLINNAMTSKATSLQTFFSRPVSSNSPLQPNKSDNNCKMNLTTTTTSHDTCTCCQTQETVRMVTIMCQPFCRISILLNKISMACQAVYQWAWQLTH